ncbi:MAG: GNAT family N-acetyltransferase [Anaerolineae bacterium]|nr:GNAT family N-acetyltransferase [Anaerolineae bacterium]
MNTVRIAAGQLKHFVVRRPTLEDAAAVTGLINVCAVIETGSLAMTVDQLLQIWASPGFDLQTDAWMVFDPVGQLVGYAELWEQPPYEAPYVWVHVHPDYVGRGIGIHLLSLAEGHVRQAARCDMAGRRVVLRVATICLNQTARRMLSEQGFRLTERFWRSGEGTQGAGRSGGPVDRIALRTFVPGEQGLAAYRYDIYEKELCA